MRSSKYTDEEMINSLQAFYKEHEKKPTIKDFKGKRPSNTSIVSRYGTWKKALEAADIPFGKLRANDYTKEELINQIIDYVKKNKKSPTYRDMRKQGYAGVHAFINHFGSFKNALIEADVFKLREDKHQFYVKEYSEEELLTHLRAYMKDKERIPKHSVITEELKYPGVGAYQRKFGNVYAALKQIGYDYVKQCEEDNTLLKRDMINKYKTLKNELCRVPSSRDIEHYSRNNSDGYSMSTYEFHFGSLHNLQTICGYISTGLSRNKNKEELIHDLIELSKELGRTPIKLDVDKREYLAGTCKYISVFGSWNEALMAAGLNPNQKTYTSVKGTECLSYYELLFTNMLESKDIKFSKEDYYSEFMDTDRKYRFDFVIDIKGILHFVEIFGITSNDTYESRIATKRNICLKNNIQIIEIYPKDFDSYEIEDIYIMFQSKINSTHNNPSNIKSII